MPKRQDQGGWPDTGFSRRLKELRQQAGLTQAELAERAGCNKFTVAKLEADKQVPAWPLVLALAEALGKDCTALLSDDARLSDLLLRWEEVSEQGKPISPEELCQANPDLLPALRSRIGILSNPTPESLRSGVEAGQTSLPLPLGSRPAGQTAKLADWTRLRGDEQARNALLTHAYQRLRLLTRKMLKDYPAVRRWEETDDVLQNAMTRLHGALAAVPLESSRHFYNLATQQIRRELIDLARHYLGPEGQGAKHHTDPKGRAADDEGGCLQMQADNRADEPESLQDWTAFHEQVEALPDEAREVFGLLWYGGLAQEEAASVLGVSRRTVKRLWQSARLKVAEGLSGDRP